MSVLFLETHSCLFVLSSLGGYKPRTGPCWCFPFLVTTIHHLPLCVFGLAVGGAVPMGWAGAVPVPAAPLPVVNKKKRRFDAAPVRRRAFTRFGERKLPGVCMRLHACVVCVLSVCDLVLALRCTYAHACVLVRSIQSRFVVVCTQLCRLYRHVKCSYLPPFLSLAA